MLPAVPLVIIVAVSTAAQAATLLARGHCGGCGCFRCRVVLESALGFSPEDNLAYRDYVVLHQNGERFLEARFLWRTRLLRGRPRMN